MDLENPKTLAIDSKNFTTTDPLITGTITAQAYLVK